MGDTIRKALLVIFIFTLASFVTAQELGRPFFGYVDGTYTDISGLEWTPNENGLIKLSKGGETLGHIGIAIRGTRDGNNFTYYSNDQTWDWDHNKNLQVSNAWETLTGTNNNTTKFEASQEITFLFAEDKPKIEYKIKNNGSEITNGVFWFVLVQKQGDKVRLGLEEDQLRRKTLREFDVSDLKAHRVRINDAFAFDWKDVLEDFEVEKIMFGETSFFGRPLDLLAIGITKDGGVFPAGATVTIDPTSMTQGFNDGNKAGDPFNEWRNGQNILVLDGATADTNAIGQRLSVSDFNFSIPHDSTILGIQFQMEFSNDPCFGGGSVEIDIEVSPDNGATYTDVNRLAFANIDCGDSGNLDYGGQNDTFGLWWEAEDFNDGNFNIKLEPVFSSGSWGGTSFLRVDNITAKVTYFNAPDNNVIREDVDGYAFLAVAEDHQIAINESNIILYYPFDLDDENQGEDTNQTLDLSRYQRLGVYSSDDSTKPDFDKNGYIGGALNLRSSSEQNVLSAVHTSQDVDTNFTVNSWVKTASTRGTIGDSGVSLTALSWRFNTNTLGKLVMRAQNVSNETIGNLGNPCTSTFDVDDDNGWHMATLTYDNNEFRIYGDGVLNKTCAFTGTIKKTGAKVRVGCTSTISGPILCFNGFLDDFMYLRSTLTESEISDLYVNNIVRFRSGGQIDVNSFSADANINRVDVNANIARPEDSNLSIASGDLDTSTTPNTYGFGPFFAFDSDNNASGLGIETPSDYSLRWLFNADSNLFTSPILDFDITRNHYYACDWKGYGDFNVSCGFCGGVSVANDLEGGAMTINNLNGPGDYDLNVLPTNPKFIASEIACVTSVWVT